MGIPDFDRNSLMHQSEVISKEAHRLVFEESNWELCKTSRIGTIHKAKGSFDHKSPSFKAETKVNLPPAIVEDLIHPTERYRPQWDPFINVCEQLIELDDRMNPTLMGLLSARDVIDVVEFQKFPDYAAVVYGSVVEEKSIPVESKYVRAFSYPSGVFCFKTEQEDWTRVVVLFQAELHFSVLMPRSIQEAATPTMVNQYITALAEDSPKLLPLTPLTNCCGRRK